MTDAEIKHMTERFLSWKLPDNFNPDNGISAQRPNYAPSIAWEPTGTNLFDYTQAEAMVRHMVEGLQQREQKVRAALVEAANRLAWIAKNEPGSRPDINWRWENEARAALKGDI